MKRALALLVMLAAALSGGVGHSQATFVAASSNPTTFSTAASFNTVAVTLADPGTPVRGNVPLSATATSDFPLTSVTLQRSPAGAGTWTTICTPAAAPYGCSWNTTGVSDGLYDLRAVANDSSGYSNTSVVATRRVDNTAPTVSVSAPGPLTGTANVSATATDAGSGVTSVAFDYKPTGSSTWTPICTDGTAPYSCSLDTALLADGDYDVRGTATDTAGNSSNSTVTRRADNNAPTITLTNPGAAVTTGVTLQSTTADGNGTGVTSVRYEYRANSTTGSWTTICTASSAPFSCAWSAMPPDGLYDLRAVASDGANLPTTSATITALRVDTVNPSSATMTNPGSPLHGSVTLGGTGADADSGMGSMRIEVKPTSGSTWTTACTDTTPPSPFSCSWDSTTVTDASYDFRAVAIDVAGNARTSAAVTGRVVDNTGPVVSVTSPGMFRSSTTVNATATDTSGVQSVTIQYRPAGTGTYTNVCADTTSPYSCGWSVAALADGPYDVRALATDSLGTQSTSAVVSAYVNNDGPIGTNIQGTNGGTNDRLDAGDSVVFSFNEQIAPATVLAGWNGTSTAISVRVDDNGGSDTMQFYDAANTAPLNLLATGTTLTLRSNYVIAASRFNATIQQTGSTITVTIGTLASGAVRQKKVNGNSPMTWTPSSAMTNLAGLPALPAQVTESGGKDVDF